MSKKVLIIATIDEHIRHFHLPLIEMLNGLGYEVDIASNGSETFKYVNNKYNVPLEKSPFNYNNIKAYYGLKKIIKKNNYDVIHVNMPMGAAIGRMAAKKYRKFGTKVIYTAHGFHFFKGTPFINWLLYYPVEKYLSKYTDILITINKEDYTLSTNKFKAKENIYIPGVGVDLNEFSFQIKEKKDILREKHCFSSEDFILVYVAELSNRKNQSLLIEAVNMLERNIPNIKLLLVGKGDKSNEYSSLIEKYNLQKKVFLMGYRTDVNEIMSLSDIAVSSSKQEGLPVNIIEAMAIGLPLVVSDTRGNRDLVVDGSNGFIYPLNDLDSLVKHLLRLYNNPKLREELSVFGLNEIKKYSVESIVLQLRSIYEDINGK